MIRFAALIVQFILLALAAIWVASLSGHVRLDVSMPAFPGVQDAMSYNGAVDIRLLILAAVAILALILILHRLTWMMVDLPRHWRRRKKYRDLQKGLRAVTLGFGAIAAGEGAAARAQAEKAKTRLAGSSVLPLMIEAQAARLEGRPQDADMHFRALMDHKDAALIGLRGLMQSAIEAQNMPYALNLARKALKQHPKQIWIMRAVYDLEIRLRQWSEAWRSLERLEKEKGLPAARMTSDRIAMLLLQAEEDLARNEREAALAKLKKAKAYDPSSVPACLALARYYARHDRPAKAIKIIEAAWSLAPHPDYAPLWATLIPAAQPGKGTGMERMKWHERLAARNPSNSESRLMLARAAIEEKLWGDARMHLGHIEDTGQIDARFYLLKAELEDKTTGIAEFVLAWRDKARNAPAPETWICTQTGRSYERWSPLAAPHGSFNTIVWGRPYQGPNALPGPAVLPAADLFPPALPS